MDPSLLGKPMSAPTAHKPPPRINLRLMTIGLSIAIALSLGALLLMTSGDSTQTLQQRLSARNTSLLKVLADGQKNITNDDLRKFNSELTLVLTGDAANVQSVLKIAGAIKIDKTITAEESNAQTLQKLIDAKLNGRYDTAYKQVLSTQLESLSELLRELYGATTSRSLREATNTQYKHVTTYRKQLTTLP